MLTKEEMQKELVSRFAEELGLEEKGIDVGKDFNEYGLSSVTAVGLVGELEEWLKQELSPTLILEYPTIESLAQYLTDRVKGEVKKAGFD